jgi:Tfp pilus assembly protein PilF
MSLLMKALKQAEQSKRSADKEDSAPAPEDDALSPEAQPDLDLEMAPATDAKPLEPAEFKPHFSDLQADTAPSPTFELSRNHPDRNHADRSHSEKPGAKATGKGPDASPDPRRPSFAPPAGMILSGTDDPQHGKHGRARNLFAAKLPVRPTHKPLFWAIAAVAVLMVAAIQGYRLWKEYTRPANFSSDIPVSSALPLAGSIEKPRAEAPFPPIPSTENEPIPAMKPPSMEASAAPSPAEPKAPELPPAAAAGKASSLIIPEAKPVHQRATKPAGTGSPRQTVRSRSDETVDPQYFTLSGRDPIRITPSKQPQRSGSQIDIAYQSFMQNDFITARKAYQNVLESDSTNRDALLGLAAIAVKSQHPEEAAAYYQRLLSLDPKDSVAQAGMIGITGNVNPIDSESRIKTLLSQQPNSDYLYFALGNIYLSQSRWPEAQEAFFHAYQLSPDNPDYTFNLAVSLDHLNQPRPAADFYRKSLDLSLGHPANFDRESLENRLRILTAEDKP